MVNKTAFNLPHGTPVRVSDGTPKPPKHHNRKLAKWKNRNYTGTIKKDTIHNGDICVEPDSPKCSFMTFTNVYRPYSNVTIEPI